MKTLGYDKACPRGLQSIYSTEGDESEYVTNIEQCHPEKQILNKEVCYFFRTNYT